MVHRCMYMGHHMYTPWHKCMKHTTMDHTCMYMYHLCTLYIQVYTGIKSCILVYTCIYLYIEWLVYTCIYHVHMCLHFAMYLPCAMCISISGNVHTYIPCMVYVHTIAFDLSSYTMFIHICIVCTYWSIRHKPGLIYCVYTCMYMDISGV